MTDQMEKTFQFVGEKRSSLSGQVYAFMREQIVTLQRAPFEPISEQKISQETGASRQPVREALARLAADRLVDIYPQRGTFIAPFRLSDLKRSQFMREALEVGLVLRVTNLPDRAKLVAQLRAEIDLQRTFQKIGDEKRFYGSDEDFHRLIATHAGLPGVWDEILRVKTHMDRCRHLALATVEDISSIIAQHERIVDAIETGDAQEATDAVRVHLRRILHAIDDVAEMKPDYFEPSDAGSSLYAAVVGGAT